MHTMDRVLDYLVVLLEQVVVQYSYYLVLEY